MNIETSVGVMVCILAEGYSFYPWKSEHDFMILNWIEKWERVGIHGLAREPIHFIRFSILRDRHHKVWDEIILRFLYFKE